MVRKREQSRLKELLCEAITVLCKASLSYRTEFNIEGLVGITVDNEEIFLINLNEHIRKAGSTPLGCVPNSSPHSFSPTLGTSVKSEPGSDVCSGSPAENSLASVIPKYVPPKRRRLAGPDRSSLAIKEEQEERPPSSPRGVSRPATPSTRPSIEDAGGGGIYSSGSSAESSHPVEDSIRPDREQEEETPPATPGCSSWPNLAAITANHLRSDSGDSSLTGLEGVTVKSEVPDEDVMRQQALDSFLTPGDGAALCGPLRGLPWPVMPPELVSGVHAGTLQQLHSLTLSGHYCTQIPARGRLGRPRKRCRVCWALGQRRETRYCCAGCHSLPGLCPQPCFIMFHMEKHLLPADDAAALSILPMDESSEGLAFLADPELLQRSHSIGEVVGSGEMARTEGEAKQPHSSSGEAARTQGEAKQPHSGSGEAARTQGEANQPHSGSGEAARTQGEAKQPHSKQTHHSAGRKSNQTVRRTSFADVLSSGVAASSNSGVQHHNGDQPRDNFDRNQLSQQNSSGENSYIKRHEGLVCDQITGTNEPFGSSRDGSVSHNQLPTDSNSSPHPHHSPGGSSRAHSTSVDLTYEAIERGQCSLSMRDSARVPPPGHGSSQGAGMQGDAAI